MIQYAPIVRDMARQKMKFNAFGSIWWWRHGSEIRGPVAV